MQLLAAQRPQVSLCLFIHFFLLSLGGEEVLAAPSNVDEASTEAEVRKREKGECEEREE